MYCNADMDVIKLEMGRGIFSAYSYERFEKYLAALDRNIKRYGVVKSFNGGSIKFISHDKKKKYYYA